MGGNPLVPSTGDQPLCAGAEHHEAAGCWHKDLRMVHMEEGTERNLHSGHMVYMTALREVGVGTGGRDWGGVCHLGTPMSGPGRRGRASEGMGTRPLRWTYGHSRQEMLISKGTTQVHSH